MKSAPCIAIVPLTVLHEDFWPEKSEAFAAMKPGGDSEQR
jgi:hypothetical protein